MRNTLFDGVPRRRIPRSVKNLSHDNKTSMSVGTLYPISCIEVLPDDVFTVGVKQASRVSTTFLKPIMDNLVCELHAFFCPLTLGFDDAHKVFGNPSPNAYTTTQRASIPFYSDIDGQETITISLNTVNERLGLPIGTYSSEVDCIEPRLFASIYEEYFRDENVISPMLIQKGAPTSSEVPNNNAWSPSNYNGQLPKVSKMRDYFTSCVPKPQKGESVGVPVEVVSGSTAPLKYSDTAYAYPWQQYFAGTQDFLPAEVYGVALGGSQSTIQNVLVNTNGGNQYFPDGSFKGSLLPNPLSYEVDLGNVNIGTIAVEDIRLATALQRMLEVDASYGSHYHDYLIGHFDCFIRDDVVQRPEYLGGGLIPITIQQVNQTSAGTETDPLGTVAGTSLTNGFFRFNRKFKQHGRLFIVAFIRQYHSYQQGVPKRKMKRFREDMYDPLLAHLGEQPVYTSEIYANGSTDLKGQVFGYNVAYADYQFLPNQITGQMRSGVTNSFDLWHLGDYFSNAPALVPSFIEENTANIDRVLSAESSVVDNFLAEFYFDIRAVRKMPHFTTPSSLGV